jgi:hypothetical protein
MRAGFAQVDYEPPVGLPLMGHFRDDFASAGTHDPLHCRAVVFADAAGTKLALASVDICELLAEHTGIMQRFIADQCDIPGENIIIAATHTHGGPATFPLYTCPAAEPGQIEACLKRAAAAVLLANRRLEETQLSVGYAREDRISFCRRLKCSDGRTHMNWETLPDGFVIEPLGRIDPQILALCLERDKKPLAAVVNFALHPAILDYENQLYTADYPGYLAESLRKTVADDFMTIFLNGCCGDINHIDYRDRTSPRRGYHMAQRVGYMLAAAAHQAMSHRTPVVGDALAVSREQVTLKRLKITEEMYRLAREAMAGNVPPPSSGNDGLVLDQTAPVYVRMYENQRNDGKVDVTVFRIGDLAVVGLPGEIFCELGTEIKKQSPARHTLVVELANGAIGYVPTRQAYEQGGYEPSPGAAFFGPGSGEALVASALNQLNKLFAQ